MENSRHRRLLRLVLRVVLFLSVCGVNCLRVSPHLTLKHMSAIFSISPRLSDQSRGKMRDSVVNSLAKISEMKVVKQRAAFAIIGAAVADAATRPFHWVYNQTFLDESIGDKKAIEFWPVSMSPFYSIPTGQRSCYSDEALVMLKSFSPQHDLPTVPLESYFSFKDFEVEMIRMFAPPSEYAQGLLLRKEAYEPSKRLEERSPIEGKWQHGSVTAFLDAVSAGQTPPGNPTSMETDGFCSVIPLIARFAVAAAEGKLSNIQQAEETILAAAKLLSSNTTALAHTLANARILFSVIGSGEVVRQAEQMTASLQRLSTSSALLDPDELQKVEAQINTLTDSLNADIVAETNRFGKACANPGSFMGAWLAILQSTSDSSDEEKFRTVIRKIIRSGGCNCSRANLAGAVLGASYGVCDDDEASTSSRLLRSSNGIPLSWMLRCEDIAEIVDLARKAVENL